MIDKKLFNLLWDGFAEKERLNFLKGKRKYSHFDRKIGFSQRDLTDKSRFKQIFSSRFKNHFNKAEKLMANYYPLIRVVIKTPRYKWNDQLSKRILAEKKRELYYASHFDALRYSWIAYLLDYCYEQHIKKQPFDRSILAYRKLPGKQCNVDFAKTAFEDISKMGNCTALAFDITKFFDTISHKILYRSVLIVLEQLFPQLGTLPPAFKSMFKNITRFQYVQREVILDLFPLPVDHRICTPNDFRQFIRGGKLIHVNSSHNSKDEKSCGIPQGSPVSAILANISMLEFDEAIYNITTRKGGKYYRYSDDILIICPNKSVEIIKKLAEELIEEFGMQYNDKTEIIYFQSHNGVIGSYDSKGNEKKLQYLGFETNGREVYIRSSSISRYHRKMRKGVRKTVAIATGRKGNGLPIYKTNLLLKFTQRGKNNFTTYASRAKKVFDDSPRIAKQYSSQFYHLARVIKKRATN